MNIHFFTEEIEFRIRRKKIIRRWIFDTAKSEGATIGEISVIFCSDEYLSILNRKYLHHSTLTDILTFPMLEMKDSISGDIFISTQRVKENAVKFSNSLEVELHRVIIHGILHLLGYGDSTKDEKCLMRRKENLYLEILTGLLSVN